MVWTGSAIPIESKEVIYVILQFACVAALALTGPVLTSHMALRLLMVVSLLLASWAILQLGPSRMRATPDVHRKAQFVTGGPFRLVRHPMYTSLLLLTLAWLIDRFTVTRLLVWMALLAVLLLKLRREEHLLRERFPDYDEYARRTKRLIPYVF